MTLLARSSVRHLLRHKSQLVLSIVGVALGVVATYVFHFVLFGVLATKVGLGRLFLGVAAAVAGRFAGGPAKISIFGSALFGMISGSSVANTVTVGSLTIPMMIRLGYQRHFAAAVESSIAGVARSGPSKASSPGIPAPMRALTEVWKAISALLLRGVQVGIEGVGARLGVTGGPCARHGLATGQERVEGGGLTTQLLGTVGRDLRRGQRARDVEQVVRPGHVGA